MRVQQDFLPIDLINDPQNFAEKLFNMAEHVLAIGWVYVCVEAWCVCVHT